MGIGVQLLGNSSSQLGRLRSQRRTYLQIRPLLLQSLKASRRFLYQVLDHVHTNTFIRWLMSDAPMPAPTAYPRSACCVLTLCTAHWPPQWRKIQHLPPCSLRLHALRPAIGVGHLELQVDLVPQLVEKAALHRIPDQDGDFKLY